MSDSKSNDELPKWVQAILFCLVVGIAFAAVLMPCIAIEREGQSIGYRKAMREAIEHGYAEYDSKTGELRWKEQ